MKTTNHDNAVKTGLIQVVLDRVKEFFTENRSVVTRPSGTDLKLKTRIVHHQIIPDAADEAQPGKSAKTGEDSFFCRKINRDWE